MKRPLVLFLFALITGILVAYISNSYMIIILILVVASLLFILLIIKLPGKTRILFMILLFYTAGAFQSLSINRLNTERFRDYEGEEVLINGTIYSEPDIRENSVKYVVKVKDILGGGRTKKTGGKILLTTVAAGDTGYFYEYGREVFVEGIIEMPKGKRNPGGFDYRRYLAQSGITAMVFAKGGSIRLGEVRNRGIPAKMGIAVRHRIIDTIDASLPTQQAALLNGMLIGYRGGLSKKVQQAFSDSGLMHIMAVSGANVAFIVMPLVFIFKKIGLRKKTSNLTIIALLIFFLFITGFEPSVVRAVIMASVVLGGQIIHREADVFTSLSLSAIVLLLWNPYTLFNIGFQLSYSATISLVLFSKNIKDIIKFRFLPGPIADAVAVTAAAQAGVLPVSILYFNKVSLISLVSNMLALPLTGTITVLGLAMVVLGQASICLSKFVGYINCALLSFVLFITKVTSDLPLSSVRVLTPPVTLIAIYYLALWFFLWYKPQYKIKINKVYYITGAALLVLVPALCFLWPKGLEVVFMDVGSGDSAFIRTYKGRTVLIDGGGYNTKLSRGSNIGESVIIPFLMAYGVPKLDLVAATHGHDDHIQGLIPVLENIKVGCLVVPDNRNEEEFESLLKICSDKNIMVRELARGDRIRVDDLTCLDVLYPLSGGSARGMSLNNGSLVLKLNYRDVSVIFPGDIEKEAEKLLADTGLDIRSDVLKVSHHGSDTSTTEEFLNSVCPKVAVISVGKNNFGHPSEQVIKRLESKNAVLFRTDINGAVVMKTKGDKLVFRKMIEN